MEPTHHSAVETFSGVFSVRNLQWGVIGVLIAVVISKLYCLLTIGRCKSTRSMEGKTLIITGANTGVGLETAKELCRRKARVILACRDLDKARLAAAEIGRATGVQPVCMQLDLCSFKSIRRFAQQITEREKRLDVLINNAGKIAPPKRTVTEDGFESTFQTNHLGHFLLTNLLLDLLKKSAPSRVVVVGSSVMFYIGKMNRSNLDFQHFYRQSKVYSTTKLYNMLFTVELSRRLSGTGIGLETAKELCRRNARVILACRDLDKARLTAAEIAECTGVHPVCMQLDLCSFKSVRQFAKQFTEREERLDVLINNAGKMAAFQKTRTEDGFESTLQTNHLGHFLLTNLLLDMLKKSAPSRIVVVGSNMIWLTKMDRNNFDFTQSYRPADVYNTSKLYNMLFVAELSRKLKGTGVTINCGHPGVVKSSIASRSNDFNSWMAYLIVTLFGKTPDDGSQTSVHLAVSEELEAVSGRYFADCQQARTPPWAIDPDDAQFLWKASEDMTGLC